MVQEFRVHSQPVAGLRNGATNHGINAEFSGYLDRVPLCAISSRRTSHDFRPADT